MSGWIPAGDIESGLASEYVSLEDVSLEDVSLEDVSLSIFSKTRTMRNVVRLAGNICYETYA